MRGFFEDDKGNKSMIRLLSFGCYVTGTIVAVIGVIIAMPEAVVSGSTLTAVGLATKTLQKKYENGGG